MKKIKRLLVLAMSLCMTVGLLTIPTHAEEIETIVIDGPTMTLEEVQEDIKTRGASDEYYELISINYTSGDIYYKSEKNSVWIDAGSTVVNIATATIGYAFPVSGWVTSVTFSTVSTYLISKSKYYDRVTDHYYKKADMYYKVTNAMGQVVRYQNYTDIKVPSKKVYSYN